VTHWAPLLQTQIVRRATQPAGVPGHWANGAIEDPIRIAREVIGDRAWTLRNRTRLNLLLDLVRLRINKLDSQAAYATAIRKHLDATGGARFTRPRSLTRTTRTVGGSTRCGRDSGVSRSATFALPTGDRASSGPTASAA
jgi:hypothetical protein